MIAVSSLKHSRVVKRLLLALGLLAAMGPAVELTSRAAHGSDVEVATDHSAVKVLTQRDGDVTRFRIDNREYGEITMTFAMSLVNLKGDVVFPYTLTCAPRKVTEAFSLTPVNPDAKWEYDYTNYFKLGSNCARHDHSVVYLLPYAPGTKCKVTQGYNGKFSHSGSNQYAIDWEMSQGTLVSAARGGVVVRARDDSAKGGPSIDYDRYNNYILIRHDDGTMGHYCHLQQGGCLVKVGQRVEAGQPIAHSGSTGFSSGPHLHFSVFMTKNGRERVSIPVKFRTAKRQAVTLVSGRSYRADEVQGVVVSRRAAETATHAIGAAIR